MQTCIDKPQIKFDAFSSYTADYYILQIARLLHLWRVSNKSCMFQFQISALTPILLLLVHFRYEITGNCQIRTIICSCQILDVIMYPVINCTLSLVIASILHVCKIWAQPIFHKFLEKNRQLPTFSRHLNKLPILDKRMCDEQTKKQVST